MTSRQLDSKGKNFRQTEKDRKADTQTGTGQAGRQEERQTDK